MREELLRLGRNIDQIFTLVGRAGPKGQDGKAVGPGGCLRFNITGIDRAQPLGRWQFCAEDSDGDEQPVARRHRRQRVGDVVNRSRGICVRHYVRFGVSLGRRERRPQEGKIDAIVRPRMSLHCGADRPRRNIEEHACDRDRNRWRVKRDGRGGPTRPQHVGNERQAGECKSGQEPERQSEHAARAPTGRVSRNDVRRHAISVPQSRISGQYATVETTRTASARRVAAPRRCSGRKAAI